MSIITIFDELIIRKFQIISQYNCVNLLIEKKYIVFYIVVILMV